MVLCSGCGQPLTTRSQRGRPARYHGATCRQRARRARLATDQHATLGTLTALETAVRELRHALLTNQDTSPARSRIATATAELTRQFTDGPVPTSPDQSYVTESVMEPAPLVPVTVSRPVPTTTDEPADPIHESPARVVKTVDLAERIGPGWTLVQHEGEADAALWHVHHDGNAVGTIRRAYDLATNTRGWEARTARFDQVRAVGSFAASRRTERLWRTRDSAAAGIAAHATPTRAARRRRRPR
ncbi:MAG TPA: hypothetical protein VFW65_12750 [Pseudonocardiaceae bacterium]|nr:hypothetical protein [Pseudonocardiaceae bacterium]